MNMKDLGLVPSVAQCVKDAEGTAEIIQGTNPTIEKQSQKTAKVREALSFSGGGLPHLKRLQQLESTKINQLIISNQRNKAVPRLFLR